MKRYFLLVIIVLVNIVSPKAQDTPANDKLQKIQAAYVAFVTQRLSLTPEEAQKFWPVHTQFLNEIKAVKPNMAELDKQQAILNIKKKYQGEFVKILGTERTDRFFKTNADFNKKLLERIQKLKMRNTKKGM